MIALNSAVPVGTVGEKNIMAVRLLPTEDTLKVGTIVEASDRGSKIGTKKILSVKKMELSEVKHADLIGFLHADPRIFWDRLEKGSGTGLPGDSTVVFYTVGDSFVEDLESNEDEKDSVEETSQPTKMRNLHKKFSSDDEG